MERKWDINLVANPRNPQKEILQKALAEIGVTDADQPSTIIDSILDWVNPNCTCRLQRGQERLLHALESRPIIARTARSTIFRSCS